MLPFSPFEYGKMNQNYVYISNGLHMLEPIFFITFVCVKITGQHLIRNMIITGVYDMVIICKLVLFTQRKLDERIR